MLFTCLINQNLNRDYSILALEYAMVQQVKCTLDSAAWNE